MPSYKDLYFKLLRAQSKAVELLTTTAQEAEEVVISEEESAISLAEHGEQETDAQ